MPENLQLSVLPLRDSVLFPGVSLPIGVGRAGTLRAVEAALRRPDKLIFALTQRQNIDQVSIDGLYNVGTIASIGQVQRGLNGMQLQLHGERRGMVVRIQDYQGYLLALVREPEELFPPSADDPAFLALHREARERAAELGRRSGLPEELRSEE